MDLVMDSIRSYWGGMLDRGADTFWEEFKPEEPVETNKDGGTLVLGGRSYPLPAGKVVEIRVTNQENG